MSIKEFKPVSEGLTYFSVVVAAGLLLHLLFMYIDWDFQDWTGAENRILILDIAGFCIAYICKRMGY